MNVSRADILDCADVALHGWEDEDVYLFLEDLGSDDFLRREAPRYGAFDAI